VNEKPRFSLTKRSRLWNGKHVGVWPPTLLKIRNLLLPHREEVPEDPGLLLDILMKVIATVRASLSIIDPRIATSKICTPQHRPTMRTSDHQLSSHVATHPVALQSQARGISMPPGARIQPLTSTWIWRTAIFITHLSNSIPRRATSMYW
jgi:hypothetical protein